LYPASCLIEAIDDMAAIAGPAPAELFHRFVGWARPATGRPHEAVAPVAVPGRVHGGAAAQERAIS
jgi:hypothetical protein